jgi:MSP (Major sperm protein) domain/Kinesin motor domain
MRSLHVSPNALKFSTTAGAAELTLTNDSKLHAVFKVRTTAPKSFRVHPACAVVQPESSKAVRIECRAEPSASCCDGVKFQIRYILLSAAKVAVLTDEDIKTSIWTATSMGERVSKLVVDALYVPSSSPTRSVSPRQQRPSSARSSSAVAAPSAHMLELLVKNVTKSTPLSDVEVSELRAARASLTPEQWQQWLELARTAKAQRRRSSSSSSRQGGSSRASSVAASERVRTAVPAVAGAVQARTAAAPSYSTAPTVPVNPVQLRVLQEVTRPTAAVVADHQRQQSAAAMLKAASVQLADNAVDTTATASTGRAVAAVVAPTFLQHEQSLSIQQTRVLQATQQPAAVRATTAVAANTPKKANGTAHRSTPSPLKQQQQQQGLLPPHMITEMMTAQQCLGSAEAAAAATCSAVETAMWCTANTTAAGDSSGSTTALDTAQLDALTAAMQAFRLAAAAARASLMSLARSNSNSSNSSNSSNNSSANTGLNTAAVQSCVVRAHSAAQGARSAAAGLRSDVTRCCAGFNSDVALLVSALTKLAEVDVTDSEPSPKAVTNGHNGHNGKRIAHSPQQQQQQQRDSSDSISNSNSRKQQQQQQQQQHTRGSLQMWCRVAAGVGSAIIQTNGTGFVAVNTGRGRLAFVFDRVLQQQSDSYITSNSSSSNGVTSNSDPSYSVADALQPQLEQLVHAAVHAGDTPYSVLTVVSTGCSASGKSSVLFGAGLAERGCASWLVESLLAKLQNSSSISSSGVSVTVSALELVGGAAVDLLSKHHTALNTAHKLSATRAQASHSSAFFTNAASIEVQSLAQWERVRAAITARRCSLSAASTAAATAAAGDSCAHPHSHCIVCISVAHSDAPQRSSKLYFVDLGEGDTPQDTAHSRVPLDAQQQWSETAAVVQGERQAVSELLRDLRNSSSVQANAVVYSATPLAHFTQEALCAAAQVVVITNVVGRGGAREQQEAVAALLYTETLNSSDDDAASSAQDDSRSSSSRAPQPLPSPPLQQQQQQQQQYDFRQEPLQQQQQHQQQQRHYAPEVAARAVATTNVIGGRLGASPRAVAVANSSSPVRSATAPVQNGGVHRRSQTSSSVSAGVVSGGSRLGSSLNAAGTAAMMMVQAPVLTPTGAVTAVSFSAGRRSGSSSGGSGGIRPASAGPLGYSSHLYPNRGARESPRPAVKPFRFRS